MSAPACAGAFESTLRLATLVAGVAALVAIVARIVLATLATALLATAALLRAVLSLAVIMLCVLLAGLALATLALAARVLAALVLVRHKTPLWIALTAAEANAFTQRPDVGPAGGCESVLAYVQPWLLHAAMRGGAAMQELGQICESRSSQRSRRGQRLKNAPGAVDTESVASQ